MSWRGGKKHNPKRRNPGKFNWKKNQSDRNKVKDFLATERLSEPDAGITEYVSSQVPGFTGIIKARYSDFHVNEINCSNEVAKLTDLSAPLNFFDNCEDDSEKEKEEFSKLISADVLKQLEDMLESQEDIKVEVDVQEMTKEDRMKVYNGLRALFGKKIVANTVNVEGKRMMHCKKFNKDNGTIDKRYKWPSDKGEYVYFLVYKEVMDTIEAGFKLADVLKINAANFTYAGVKDRRGKTTQWFCVHKVDPNKIVSRTKPFNKIHVGNFSFHTQPLKIGHLNGNQFKVALRNITAEDSVINNAMEALKTSGFINYYGLQRFGNDKTIPTHEIGINLLQGKFKEACELILKVREGEDPLSEIAQAKRIYKESKDCLLASKQFRKYNNKCIESKLLLGFVKNNPNDYVNSLENIPRNMRLLYIHAFQSLVWNMAASHRIKKYGLEPVEGDLVILNEIKDEVESSENLKILTNDDLKLYTIYDVVLPLPGYDIKYPENEIKEVYKTILESHNLTLEMPKQSVKTYTLSGAYRKIVGKADNISWKTLRYTSLDETLIRSDYEELKGQEEPQDNPDGKYKALILEFTLPPSSYATMVLREVLKMDTSAAAHAKLNNSHTPKEVPSETIVKEAEMETLDTSDSLLRDAEKFEEFKRQVFGLELEQPEPSKRKLDDSEDIGVIKKSKTVE